MAKLHTEMDELQIKTKLHKWHYHDNNKPEYLPELTIISKGFLNYLDNSTKSYIL